MSTKAAFGTEGVHINNASMHDMLVLCPGSCQQKLLPLALRGLIPETSMHDMLVLVFPESCQLAACPFSLGVNVNAGVHDIWLLVLFPNRLSRMSSSTCVTMVEMGVICLAQCVTSVRKLEHGACFLWRCCRRRHFA